MTRYMNHTARNRQRPESRAQALSARFAATLAWGALFAIGASWSASSSRAQSIISLPNLGLGPNDVLPVQVGGLAPGLEHDQYQVTNDAVLDGRLDLRLINGYQPSPGEQIQLINANLVSGDFASYFTPTPLPAGVAIELLPANQTYDLRFAASTLGPTFAGSKPVSDWADSDSWSTGLSPVSTDSIGLTNALPASNQVVQILSPALGGGDARAHSVAVGGVGGSQMTLRVSSDASLSATQQIVIEGEGRLQLLGGRVATSTASVLPDGVLAIDSGELRVGDEGLSVQGSLFGGGNLVGDVLVASGGEVLPGPESGSSTGVLQVSGSYTQQAGSRLHLEVLGNTPGDFDTISIEETATIEGALAIDFAPGSAALGDQFEILTAGQLSPGSRFNRVDTTGLSPGLYAATKFGDGMVGEGLVTVSITMTGDMDADGVINAADVDLFALALRSREAYFNYDTGTGPLALIADISGDADNDGDLDFDDIDDFINLLPSPVSLLARQQLLGEAVPEPVSVVMLACLAAPRCCGDRRTRWGREPTKS